MEITATEQAQTNHNPVETKEINQIDDMEAALEGLVKRIEILAQKEIESTQKFQKQELLIKDLSQENEALKQENQKLQEIINNYMKNFQCFYSNTNGSIDNKKVESAIEIENCINELQEKITNLELEKMDLETKASSQDKEKQELAKKVEIMTQDLEKLNGFISKNFEDIINHEGKNKHKAPKLKKENSARQSRKDSTDEKPKTSPMRTRHRQAKKTSPVEEQKEIDENDEEDDFEIEISGDSEGEDEEDFYTPKKGKRKAGSAKKVVPGKKVKKNENKELVAQNRNTIQYHLFG